jgi:phosphoserine phosphatase
MGNLGRSSSPTIVLRISDGSAHMHRSFNDFPQAVRSAEAFAKAGFSVAMISATGRFLMEFDARRTGRAAV